jgi:hypothetical protein
MRDYPTAEGFRAAVEAKLRDRARQLGVAAYAVRRLAALERLLARLMTTAPNRWALKGGLALETRLGARARVSLDLDAEHAAGIDAARMDLQRAAAEDIGDHFAFALTGQTSITDGDVALAVRFALESTLAGRRFEPLQVDVTVATPDPWDAQPATRPGLLSVLGLAPIDVLLIPIERQVAEKLHAYTRTYRGGGTTRGRDLVDLLLIHAHEHNDSDRLARAIQDTFEQRATHPIPAALPPPPRELAVSYRRDASPVDVAATLDDAHRELASWIDPILQRLQE